jgi:hypothetical protein
VKRPQHLGRFFKSKGATFINICASTHHLRNEPALPEVIGRLFTYDDVNYFHVKTCRYRKNNLFRLINMLGYSVRAGLLNEQVRNGTLPRPDIVIASCAHIFSLLAAWRLKKIPGPKLSLKSAISGR